ncbi:MAG: 30S ribosome-binding factor RbfA [Thermodesulfovibrionales bacterium]|nr:30S ribosome-binding factor RbfA [Thermodesulfovibrionales bacterium]
MQPYKRTQRLNILLREEIADIIVKKLKDPRIGFITVTDVELTPDLKLARVYISVMNEEEEQLNLDILNASTGLFRSEISKRIRIKHIPSIEFRADKSAQHGRRIDELLQQIKEKR